MELFRFVASNTFLFRVTFLHVKNVIDFEYVISHWLLANPMAQWIHTFLVTGNATGVVQFLLFQASIAPGW